MDFHTKPSSLSLILFTTLVIFVHAKTDSDITNLVYRGCAEQKFPNPSEVYTQNLNTLLSSLVSRSSQETFNTTTSGDDQTSITGLYQCRGDLTTPQCYTCVSKIPDLAYKLCSKAVAARVQLSGCYLKYEVIGFSQVPETELLYKICGSTQVTGAAVFEQRRNTAFNMVTNGVKNSAELFYTGTYEHVYILGECEGDIANGNCGDCVKTATERAKNECDDSISGQIYLNKCFISYSYYPNGVPNPNSSLSSGKTKRKDREVSFCQPCFHK